jgi:hypothetical protein
LIKKAEIARLSVEEAVAVVWKREEKTGLHCNESPIYVFPEKELRGLSPNFHIHVSVNDLYIPRDGPHIFLQQNRQTDCENKQIAHRHMKVEIGYQAAQFLFWESINGIVSNFRYCVFVVCERG